MVTQYKCEGDAATDSDCTPASYNKKAIEGSVADVAAMSETVAATSTEITHAWTTEADIPSVADWPNGDYTFQTRIGVLGVDSYQAIILRTNSACTIGQTLGTSTAQTSTGTFTYTISLDPTAGLRTDRMQGRIFATNDNSCAKNIRANPNIAEPNHIYLEGPWTAAVGGRNRIMSLA